MKAEIGKVYARTEPWGKTYVRIDAVEELGGTVPYSLVTFTHLDIEDAEERGRIRVSIGEHTCHNSALYGFVEVPNIDLGAMVKRYVDRFFPG